MIRALCLWLLLVASAVAQQHADSVCIVSTPDGDTGSGVLVEEQGRRFILTNAHVVDLRDGAWPEVTARFTRSGVTARVRFVDGLTHNGSADVVAYAADEIESLPAVRVGDQDASGEAFAYGHPLAGQMRVRPVHHWLNTRASYYQTPTGEAGHPVVFRGGSISGESGGPLIRSDGTLVAVIWGGGSDGLGRAVPLQPIRRLFRRIFRTQAYCPSGSCGRVIVRTPPRQPPYRPQVAPAPLAGDLEPVRRSPAARECNCDPDAINARLDQLESDIGSLAGLATDGINTLRARVDSLEGLRAAVEAASSPITVRYQGSDRTDQVSLGGTLTLPDTEVVYVDGDNSVVDRVNVPVGGRLALGFAAEN